MVIGLNLSNGQIDKLNPVIIEYPFHLNTKSVMNNEVVDFWNNVADDWHIQVGKDGDNNRIVNSDPVLWEFAGDVQGLRVLDAGCGTGYLTQKLYEKGAVVRGIDVSEKMIDIAIKNNSSEINFQVDSCSELSTVASESMDMIVSNYVLMDTPELENTIHSFYRVLNKGGKAILIFSHPCFPAANSEYTEKGFVRNYRWDFSYFKRSKQISVPWGHFKESFIWFHRPLSDYWKVFTQHGFKIIDFEEPRITPDRYHLIQDERKLLKAQSSPYSVAFKLEK